MVRYFPVILLVCILSAGSASAFTLAGFYWGYSPVPYEITSVGSDNVSDGSDLNTVRVAFVTWQEILFNRLSFQEVGLVSWLPQVMDGYSTVGWIEITDEDWRTNWAFTLAPRILAITACVYDPETRVTWECDIFVNGVHASWSTTGTPGTEDVGLVLNHEVGHFVGLGHSEDPGALMHVPATVTTPQVDDIVGARFIYFGADVFDFVSRLYQVVLGREPDEQGFSHNMALSLVLGEVETVTSAFFLSPEFLGGAGVDPTAFVTTLYRTTLNRDPDPAGLAHNVNLITTEGWPLQWLVDGFLASPEFQEKDPFRSW